MTTIRTDPRFPADDDADPTDARESTPPEGFSTRTAVLLLAQRVHFMAGILVAPFLLVLACTGLAYLFTPQINDVLYSKELFASADSGPTRPLSEQIGAALATHPNATVNAVIVPEAPERTTRVDLSMPPETDEPNRDALTVFVDPYTANVHGELFTDSDRLPAQVWLRELHSSLQLGEPGRLYAEFVASWLPFIVIGGVVLWLAGSRRKRRMREVVLPQRRLSGRGKLRARHGALGLWIAIGLLAVSATGLTWSVYAGSRVDLLVEALDAKTPELSAPETVAPSGRSPITFDRAVQVARADGLEGALTATPPEEAGEAFMVAESSKGIPIQKGSVAVDPFTAQITARQDFGDFPLFAKLTTIGVDAHTGELFGLANQLLLATLAVCTITMIVLGYRMWWKRRPVGGRTAAPPPPVWRRLPAPVVLLLALLAIGVGWALPVFGVTLVLFLVADSLITATLRRRSATTR